VNSMMMGDIVSEESFVAAILCPCPPILKSQVLGQGAKIGG
jgi:hypothetical protein